MYDFFENYVINLVIMDINFLGKNGFILVWEVRDCKNVGFIFFIGCDNDVDCILGFEIGVDDYLIKFFNFCELMIWVRNLFFCIISFVEDDDLLSCVSFNGWILDGDSCFFILLIGKEFCLFCSEFCVLYFFLSNLGKIFICE